MNGEIGVVLLKGQLRPDTFVGFFFTEADAREFARTRHGEITWRECERDTPQWDNCAPRRGETPVKMLRSFISDYQVVMVVY